MPEDNRSRSPSGLWEACGQMEMAAIAKLKADLEPFHPPFRDCYEAGVQASTLPAERHRAADMRLAALFLKRALNDLRSVWLLASAGYTSQAASVAAALFEHALAVNAMAGSQDNARKFQESSSGDLPWSPSELAQIHAKQHQKEELICGRSFTKSDFERMWREAYSAYKWMCKIKHPTLRSVAHDARSTAVRGDEYVVMAAPDTRSRDLPVKAMILMISVSRVYQAIRRFALNLNCRADSDYYKIFNERMSRVTRTALDAYRTIVVSPLPFDISDDRITGEYRLLKS